MASSRRDGQLHHLGRCEPETPHFMRTILPELLRLGKLEIPKAFIRKYGKELLDRVLLKMPTGETCTVQLEKDDARVWLGRGWKDFMERYSVQEGYLITFGFIGNSMLRTSIFDQDGYPIDYTIRCSCRTRLNCKCKFSTPGNEEAGRSSTVISNGDLGSSAEAHPESEPSDEVDPDFATFLSSAQATHRSGRGRRTRFRNEAPAAMSPFTSHIGDSESSVEVQSGPSDEDDPDFTTFLSSTERSRRSGSATNRNRSKAFVAASMFTSYKPFFIVEVQTASVAKGIVPERIMKRCDLKSGWNAVTIEYLGWVWAVKVRLRGTEGTVCHGWEYFMSNISLQAGDVCVLELVARKQFKVIVFKCRQ